MVRRPIKHKRAAPEDRKPVEADEQADSLEPAGPDDRMLAKLAQLARFGLVAEAAPILVHADAPES